MTHLTPFGMALAALVVLAALEDAWRLRISNIISLALIVAFLAAAFMSEYRVDWLSHLGAAVLMFAAGALLFAKGWFGGGDAKLLTAVALWVGLWKLPQFILYVTAAGGLLTIVLLLIRYTISSGAMAERMPKVLRKRGPIPYGIAICAGTLLMLGSIPRVYNYDLDVDAMMGDLTRS